MRCMPAVMSMGQAAGVAASLAVKGETDVRGVDVPTLQRILGEQGALLD